MKAPNVISAVSFIEQGEWVYHRVGTDGISKILWQEFRHGWGWAFYSDVGLMFVIHREPHTVHYNQLNNIELPPLGKYKHKDTGQVVYVVDVDSTTGVITYETTSSSHQSRDSFDGNHEDHNVYVRHVLMWSNTYELISLRNT